MFKFNLRTVSLLSLSVAALLSPPCAVHAQDFSTNVGPYNLTYKFTTGEVLHYGVGIDVIEKAISGYTAPPINIHIDLTTTQTVDRINPRDGSATIEIQTNSATGTKDGDPLPQDKLAQFVPPKMEIIMTPTGKITASSTRTSAAPLPGALDPNAFGLFTPLPDNAVMTTETWVDSTKLSSLGLTMSSDVTLKSVTGIDPALVAVLDAKYTTANAIVSSNGVTTTMSGDYLTSLDIPTGTIKSVVGRMTTTFTAPGSNNSQGGGNMQRPMQQDQQGGTSQGGSNVMQLEIRTIITQK